MNINLICNKVGHEDQKIIGICTDPLCQHQRSCCGLCVFQDHNTHTQSIQLLQQVQNQYKKEDSLLELVHELRNNINQQLNIIEKNIKMIEAPLFPDEINITNINKLGESISKARKAEQSNLKEQLVQISQVISNQLNDYLNRVKHENQQNQEIQLQRELEKQRQRERELKEQKERELQEQKERELQEQKERELKEQKERELQEQKERELQEQKERELKEQKERKLKEQKERELKEQKERELQEQKERELYEQQKRESQERQEQKERENKQWKERQLQEQIIQRKSNEQDQQYIEQINQKSNEFRMQGDDFYSQQKYLQAIEKYDVSLNVNQKNHHCWNNKGMALQCLDRYEEAILCFERAIEINPFAIYYSNQANSLSVCYRLKEALEIVNKAIELDPQHSDSWYQKGLILSRQNIKEEALKCLQKAVELEPSDDKLFNIGLVLQELGQLDEAIVYYYNALEYNPQNQEAKKQIQELQQLE